MGNLKKAWSWIRSFLLKLGRFMGLINSVVLLTLSFYVILLPTALLWRLTGKNKREAVWIKRPERPADHFSRQY